MIIAGHRGARAEAPENTLAGFALALDAGIQHFELDIQLSLDGEIMVFHDSGLRRTTGVSGQLSQWSSAALGQLHAVHPWVKPWAGTHIPTLSEVLDLLGPYCVWVQLEIKADSQFRMERLCNRLNLLLTEHRFRGQAIITSFNSWALDHVRTRMPDIPRGYISDRRLENTVYVARQLDCRFVIPYFRRIDEAMVESAHRHGMHLSTWTVNDWDEALRLANMGVDSIITDHPLGFSLKHHAA